MSQVFAFYYPWWGAPPIDSVYVHWNNGDPTRAWDNIGADYFPTLNPYSSGDPNAVALHMTQMKSAGVDVVVVSWWGQGSYEDKKCPGILSAALAAGLKVSFMVEPYWTSQTQLASDLAYLTSQYGANPALALAVRPTQYGPSTAPRPFVFLYAPPLSIAPVIDPLRGTSGDAIFVVRGDDSAILTDAGIRQHLGWLHADGLFNYGIYAYGNALPASPDYVAVFCATPGFDNSRKAGVTTPTIIQRNGTATYDAMWSPLAAQKVEFASVCSFNEWHEGTQIESAQPHTYQKKFWFFVLSSFTYQNYNPLAQGAYLARTAYWTGLLKAGS